MSRPGFRTAYWTGLVLCWLAILAPEGWWQALMFGGFATCLFAMAAGIRMERARVAAIIASTKEHDNA